LIHVGPERPTGKGLENVQALWDISHMLTVKADDRRRVQIPGIKGGQVFALEAHDGTVTLTPVKKAEPRTVYAKLVKKDGRLVFELPKGYTLPDDAIGKAVSEEREAQAERGHRP
jgi:hypothetical protein